MGVNERVQVMNDRSDFLEAAAGELGHRLGVNPLLPVNPLEDGAGLLLAWPGEVVPAAGVAPLTKAQTDAGQRQAAVIGVAKPEEHVVRSFDGTELKDGVWNARTARVRGHGRVESRPRDTRTFVVTAGALDPRPNAPSAVEARILANQTPRLRWIFSPFAQQLRAEEFEVYRIADPGAPVGDLVTPVATLPAVRGTTRYRWDDPLGPLERGEQRWYAVRAVGGGKASLWPRVGQAPYPHVDSPPPLADLPTVSDLAGVTAWRTPGAVSVGGSGAAWAADDEMVGDVQADDALYVRAQVGAAPNSVTEQLRFSDFGFTGLAGQITGVQVRALINGGEQGGVETQNWRLIVGGENAGDDMADPDVPLPVPGDGWLAFGGAGELFGTSPTVQQAEALDFGWFLRAAIIPPNLLDNVRVGLVQMRLFLD